VTVTESLLDTAIHAIDAANAADPSKVEVRGERLPLALAHGRLAASWVPRLADDPDDGLLLAARAHHLRRFEVPRSSYPEGRSGYLRWRRDQKRRHAEQVGELLAAVGYDADTIGRVQALVRRDGLGSDAGAQVIEDAACLAFLETQLADVAARMERDHLASVLTKTAAKMSPAALALVAEVPLDESARRLLYEVLES
jgi:hypothetical protein